MLRRLIAVPAALLLALGGVVVISAPAQALSSVVTTLSDVVDPVDGVVSLREAVEAANSDAAADVITFQPGLSGIISLTMTLEINAATTIDATGADITVSRVNGSSFDLVVADFSDTYQDLTLIGFSISNDPLAPVDVGRGLAVFGAPDVGDVTLTNMDFFGHDGGAIAGGGGAISIYRPVTVTITGGSISSSEVNTGYYGGGLYVGGANFGRVDITGTAFASNTATLGGAVYVQNLNGLAITDATFDLNHADEFGGAVYVDDLASDGLSITDTEFSENTATDFDGGAVFVSANDGPTVVRGSTFIDNSAGRAGGAAFIYDTAAVTVEDGNVNDNFAGDDGGGIYFDLIGGSLDITRVSFDNNGTDDGDGGGVFLGFLDGATTIASSIFSDNEADGDGGGIYATLLDTQTTITDTQFLSNDAGNVGGGIAITLLDANLDITRSTFGANDASSGGVGLEVGNVTSDATLTITGSTFGLNTPASPGAVAASMAIENAQGDIFVSESTFSEPATDIPAAYFGSNGSTSNVAFVRSTIVSGDTGIVFNDISTTDIGLTGSIIDGDNAAVVVNATQGGAIATSWSIFSTAAAPEVNDLGGNQFSTDPQLGPLANNGGPTATRLPLAGSPAIDLGFPGFVAPPAFDQRGTGFARVQGGRIDIGAVEVQPLLAATGGTVSWWLLFVAGGVLILGVGALVLTRRQARH